MSFLKFNGGTCVTLVVLAMLVAISQAARTEKILLKCDGYAGILTIDLTNQTVNDMPAKITPTAINWDVQGKVDANIHIYNHIDRTTGAWTVSGVQGGDRTIPPYTYVCTIVPQTHF